MVADNWRTLTDPEEHAILAGFAKESRRLSVAYTSYLVFTAICFSQFTIVNPVLDWIYPLNYSRPMILVVRGEYVVDPMEYFYEIYILYTTIGIIMCIVMPAVDSTYTGMVLQCAGIFRIVQHRLVKATAIISNEKLARKTMISAIKLHQQSLYFVEIIESSFSVYFLLVIGGTILSSIGGCAIMENLNEPLIAIKFILFGLGIVIHITFLSWPGQLVIEESSNVFLYTYNNTWYEMSKHIEQLLLIIMQRCTKPCFFTAGGLYVMNLENAGKIVKSLVSYMTFAISLQ